MNRLDTQRAPSKTHVRPNVRKYARGYDVVPHNTWGEDRFVITTPATTAYAGIPGSWGPSGATPPATAAAATGVVAVPSTAWTTGQFVQGTTAGAPGEMCWTGSAWVGGKAP
jgi:hypothetical protein